MLNSCHRDFLQLLSECGVRFMVIGGQARHYYGTDARELALWVRNDEAVQRALTIWSNTFPWPVPRPELCLYHPDDDRLRYMGTDEALLIVMASKSGETRVRAFAIEIEKGRKHLGERVAVLETTETPFFDLYTNPARQPQVFRVVLDSLSSAFGTSLRGPPSDFGEFAAGGQRSYAMRQSALPCPLF